jgi:hypothetical protein
MDAMDSARLKNDQIFSASLRSRIYRDRIAGTEKIDGM